MVAKKQDLEMELWFRLREQHKLTYNVNGVMTQIDQIPYETLLDILCNFTDSVNYLDGETLDEDFIFSSEV